jgi:hypothetical protein
VSATPRSPAAPSPLVVAAVALALAAAVGFATLRPSTASDLWWMLATGRTIVERHAIPHADVFSWTHEGAPWFNQEWLSQVLFFETYRSLGPNALVALALVLVAAILGIVFSTARRRCGSLGTAAAAAIACALVCRPFFEIRPQLFTFLLAAVVVAVVDAFRRGARAWTLFLLPLALVAWVNLHFGFVYGAGAVLLLAAAVAVPALARTGPAMPRRRAVLLAGAAVAAALACLANPQGVDAVAFPFTILRGGNPWKSVLEWQPPTLFVESDFSPAIFGWFLAAQGLAAIAAGAIAPRRIDAPNLALVLVTAAMALSARRFIPLFAVVSTPLLAANVEIVRARFVPGRRGPRGLLVAAALLATGGLAWATAEEAQPLVEQGAFDGLTGAGFFPRDAGEVLRRNALPGRLCNLYHWGGWILWSLPNWKVYVDGRAHTVYPPEFYLEDQELLFGGPDALAILDRPDRQVALVLWPSNPTSRFRALRDRLQQSPSWKCVYADSTAALFAHVERGRAWIERFDAGALAVPDTANGQLGAFNALLAAARFEPALERLRSALARFPELRPSVEASRAAARGRASASNDAESWLRAGFFCEALGDAAEARTAYRRALDLRPPPPLAEPLRRAVDRTK